MVSRSGATDGSIARRLRETSGPAILNISGIKDGLRFKRIGTNVVGITNEYDTIVDANGDGDYTSIVSAFSAGKKTVFVKQGIYVETADIVIPDGGCLVGEAAGLVKIVFSGNFSVKSDGSGGSKETAGTVSITIDTKTVTGSGTTFTNLSVGDYICLGDVFYKIDSITDNTSLEIVETYRGNSFSGLGYIAQKMNVGVCLCNVVVNGSDGVGVYFRACHHLMLCSISLNSNTGDNLEIVDSGFVSCVSCISEHSGAKGIEIDNTLSVKFTNSAIKNNTGIGIDIINSSRNIIIDGCVASNNGGDGINITSSSSHVNITDCIITRNDLKGINTDSGTIEITIDGCLIEYNDAGIDYDSTDSRITSCLIGGNANDGIVGGDSAVIDGNHIADNGGVGINLDSGDINNIISNNYIENNTGDGIYCNGDDNLISGNRIKGNGGDGIDIDTLANDTIVLGNISDGNTGTDILDNGTSTVRKHNKGDTDTATDSDAIHDNVSGEISAITEKTTPVSADLIIIEDSAASNAKKRAQVGNLPFGDVTAAANLGDNLLIRGDGAGKGVQNSGITVNDTDDVTGVNTLAIQGSLTTDYSASIYAPSGKHGLHIKAGEVSGDIALNITDQDGSLEIMQVGADEQVVVFGKTIAQTQTDNGAVYGIDNQRNAGNRADINTQNGIYRIAGKAVMYGTEFQEASSETESSTTSQTYQEKLSLATPSLPAGTYRIGWYCELRSDIAGKRSQVRVQVDNTTDLCYVTKDPGTSEKYSFCGFKYESLSAATHTIDMDYSAAESRMTAYIRRARLEIWRVS
jgi:parallel beta-helix repeat protein